MKILLLLLPAAIAAALAVALTPLAKRLAVAVGAVDLPEERKVHKSPVPRLGGVAVIGALLVTVLLVVTGIVPVPKAPRLSLVLAIGAGLLPVFAVSVWDDIRPRRALLKLAAHVLGASVAVALGVRLGTHIHLFGYGIELGLLAFPLSVFWIVAVTNSFNLIDGLDGLSAGLALISAASLTGVFILAGRFEYALGALILFGALAGFLPSNLHPASIFLGDSGACSVGFLLACLCLQGGAILSAGLAVLVPVVILGVPLADGLLSIVRRALLKLESPEPAGIMEADRRHIHHRLLALGLTHQRAVLLLHGAGLFLGAVGFASVFFSSRDSALFVLALVFAAAVGIGRLGYEELAVLKRGTMLRLYDTPVLKRGFFVVFVDFLLVVVASYGAIGLKWEDWALVKHRSLFLELMAILPVATFLTFWLFKLYRGRWRHASVEDLLRPSAAVAVAAIGGGFLQAVLGRASAPPSFFLVYALILLVLTNGTRASYRLLAHWRARTVDHGIPVLLYGAGRRGSAALRELRARADALYRPVAFVDDDGEKMDRTLNGLAVLGSLGAIPDLVRSHGIKGIVVTSPKIPGEKVLAIEELCQELGIAFLSFRVSFEGDIAEPAGLERPSAFVSDRVGGPRSGPAPAKFPVAPAADRGPVTARG